MADEYIKRQALLDLLADEDRCGYLDGSDIRSIPAADVAPVVHGRWIEEGGVQICSNCGEEHSWEEYRATYCEDCGARMDGDG